MCAYVLGSDQYAIPHDSLDKWQVQHTWQDHKVYKHVNDDRLTHVVLIVFDVIGHVFNAILNELDGAIALPVAAQPVFAPSNAAFNGNLHSFFICHK